jgi:hypothetical protein
MIADYAEGMRRTEHCLGAISLIALNFLAALEADDISMRDWIISLLRFDF